MYKKTQYLTINTISNKEYFIVPKMSCSCLLTCEYGNNPLILLHSTFLFKYHQPDEEYICQEVKWI